MPALIDSPITEPDAAGPLPQDEPLRVVVADDHELFRQTIARAIERHPGLTLVGQAADGDEALGLIAALQPDVAVLDHRMPGLTGTEVSELLHDHDDPLPTAVLILSAFEDDDLVWNAVGAGASGYIGKSASHDAVCDAILAVGTGGVAYTERTAAAVDAGFDRLFGRYPAT